jgi:hypothetical protein
MVDAPVGQWPGFSVTSPPGKYGIVLEQIDSRKFRLWSVVRYNGDTGLELSEEADERVRTVGPRTLGETDLASVPGPFRWWAHSYGVHTPAALIHDRFIGDPVKGQPGRPDGVSEQNIDRYFRFMLRGLGVPYLRSWLMWAAVASRTRLNSGKLRAFSMIAWIAVSVGGVALMLYGLFSRDWSQIIQAALLPLPVAALWGRQAGAGLIIAYVGVPFLLLPSVLAVPFLFLYAIAEAAAAQVIEARGGYEDSDEFSDV